MPSGPRRLKWRWERAFRDGLSGKLTASARATAWDMWTYADEDGNGIFPGAELLAERAQTSKHTIYRAWRDLEAARVIVRVQTGSAASGRANEHRLGDPDEWAARKAVTPEQSHRPAVDVGAAAG